MTSGMVAETEVLWLGESPCHDRDLVGGKAAQLSRFAASFRVPPGFCLTSAAFTRAHGTEIGGYPQGAFRCHFSAS